MVGIAMPSEQIPDIQWIAEHGREIYQDHRGKWIAVWRNEIIAVGDTATEVDRAAREKVPDGDFLLEAVEHDAEMINGLL